MGGRGAGACAGLKEARFEPLLLIADAVVQAVATLWMSLTASPHVYHALLAELPICIQKHCVPNVLQGHTQTLLWAPHPATLALQAPTTLNPDLRHNHDALCVKLADSAV
jgi:hypothetical protein